MQTSFGAQSQQSGLGLLSILFFEGRLQVPKFGLIHRRSAVFEPIHPVGVEYPFAVPTAGELHVVAGPNVIDS